MDQKPFHDQDSGPHSDQDPDQSPVTPEPRGWRVEYERCEGQDGQAPGGEQSRGEHEDMPRSVVEKSHWTRLRPSRARPLGARRPVDESLSGP